MIVARSTRSLAASARRLRLPRRLLSTEAAESAAPAPSSKIVVCQDGEVASVQLSNAPVNSLTLEVCEELVAALRSLEAEPSVRGVLLGSALPTPATHKLKPQTTAKRVLFGDITKGAANNATVRKADGGVTLEPTTQKKTGRKITFQTPAKSAVKKQISFRDDEGVEEAKAEPTIEEEAPALRRGQYRDDTEPIEKPLGRLFDNDALIKELNELDEKLNPDPFPEDAFGGDDDNFDAVEDVLRRGEVEL